MAKFNEALKITLAHEGGYVKDPADRGGETVFGISRRYYPSWSGWKIVDSVKQSGVEDLNTVLNTKLYSSASQFYREHYWDRIMGDSIMNQEIANKVFDMSVNLGVHTAVKMLQKALNLLNRNQRSYADIVVDGIIGNNTLMALNSLLKIENDDPTVLLNILFILQGIKYINLADRDSKQERFLRGWIKRLR